MMSLFYFLGKIVCFVKYDEMVLPKQLNLVLPPLKLTDARTVLYSPYH